MPETSDTSLHVRIISSSIGGIITAFMMTPLDVVKIRMQSNTKMYTDGKCLLYCDGLMDHICSCSNSPFISSHVKKPVKMNSSLDAVKYIIKNDGVKSLWSGLSPTLVMALPQTIIYYSLNDFMKDKFLFYDKSTIHNSSQMNFNQYLTTMTIAGISRSAAVISISPIELTRTKMQSIKMTYVDTFTIIRETVKKSGLSSLWLGIGPTLLRDIPYSMFFFAIFDYFKYDYLYRHKNRKHMTYFNSFSSGFIAGFVAGILTHPFDVIKTHQQIQLGEALINQKKPIYSSTMSAIKTLYSRHGINALYSGFVPRIIKTSFASAIMISTFEASKGYFSNIGDSFSAGLNSSKN